MRVWGLALAAVLAMTAPVFAQVKEPPGGFQNVKWGQDPQTVVDTLAKRYKYAGLNKGNLPTFRGNIIGVENAEISLSFNHFELNQVFVTLPTDKPQQVLVRFFDAVMQLSLVYGFESRKAVMQKDGQITWLSNYALTSPEITRHHADVQSSRSNFVFIWDFPNGETIFLSTSGEPDSEFKPTVMITYSAPQRMRSDL